VIQTLIVEVCRSLRFENHHSSFDAVSWSDARASVIIGTSKKVLIFDAKGMVSGVDIRCEIKVQSIAKINCQASIGLLEESLASQLINANAREQCIFHRVVPDPRTSWCGGIGGRDYGGSADGHRGTYFHRRRDSGQWRRDQWGG